MRDVAWMVTYDGQSGGNWVRRQVAEGLADAYDVRPVTVEPTLSPLGFPRSVWSLATTDDPAVDCWVETLASLALRVPTRRRPNVLALHHLATPDRRSLTGLLTLLKNELVLARAREADRVVVVSDYWAEYLAERGVTDNVVTVYNGLPIERFSFDPAAVAAVREELCEDPDRPLIHVGMCAPGKGGDAVAKRLGDRDATLITTGRVEGEPPVTHLNPPYDEYLRVLAACDVFVAMSSAREGWGLQVQEAMCCATPVVGSGRGGMEMLLEGGDQVVCHDLDDLEACVDRALREGEAMGERGRAFASQFTRERMVEGWRSVFDDVVGGGGSDAVDAEDGDAVDGGTRDGEVV